MSNAAAFTGSIPGIYDRCLGPLLFQPYAEDMAARTAAFAPGRILETAAGTGIVTEALIAALPDSNIVATDLNQAMLDIAAAKMSSSQVRFQQADAQHLPFEDAAFDAIVCQFGFMFFPDRLAAYREARRVLARKGKLLFNVWDELANNSVSATVSAAMSELFPDDPPSFLQRVPFGYANKQLIRRELEEAGFTEVSITTVERRSRTSVEAAAEGLCLGTPLRAEIEARDPDRLEEAQRAALRALTAKFGWGEITEALSAHVIVATA